MLDVKEDVCTRICKEILTLNEDDIRKVLDAVKVARDILSKRKMFEFGIGEEVYSDAGRRGVIHGKIEKINRSTICVRANASRMLWRVAPSLLKKSGA